MSRTEPITDLETSDAYDAPDGAWWAKTRGGEFGADSLAWSEDANETQVKDIKKYVGASSVSANGSGTTVAVIDSGVTVGDGRTFGNGTASSDIRISDAYDFVENESADIANGTYDAVEDPNGHGTWVAAAAVGAEGIAPGADLLAYRALNEQGEGSTADIVDAIRRADNNGADIIIMSLGSPIYSDPLASEIQRVLDEGNVTAVYVAAGNSYTTTRWVTSPADVDGVIAVSATAPVNNSTAKKAYFANVGPDAGADGSGAGEQNTRGAAPDTAAPGMNLTVEVPTINGGYTNRTLSGTSMSTPIAGGVGALVLDAKPTLKGQPEVFKERIVNSGAHTPKLGLTESRGGYVNASRAINGWGTDAPERDLNDQTEGTDAGNHALSGNVGRKMAAIARFTQGAAGVGGILG